MVIDTLFHENFLRQNGWARAGFIVVRSRHTMPASASTGVTSVFNVIVTVLMILSIVGAFCVIVTFGINPRGRLRTYPIKLIMYLCVCIVIGFTAFLIAFEPYIYNNEGLCITIAVFVHYYFIANFLWTFCIAFNFYQMIVRRNRQAQDLEKYFHVVCWGIPAIFCIFTGAFDQYGDLGGAYVPSSLCPLSQVCDTYLFYFVL